jgi:aspartyl-tRNA(Asn)/glutamyl-tRNA(Gln) amidotransferase subunit A
MPTAFPSLSQFAQKLRDGEASSESLTRLALERATSPGGEGARTFLQIDHAGAIAQARAADTLRSSGIELSPLMGIPISVKDLFDVAGQVTRAGSTVLKDAPPATKDASVVTRLRAAGAVIVGRTNMVEFAYSGLGLNPHYGTPRNPFERDIGRVPGGSSSGAAVAVTDGMCAASIGTDTGGSVRIPAAFCGLTGFKPTAARIPRDGVLPLSSTLDSIGPLAASVECCATLDAILAGDAITQRPAPAAVNRLQFVVPTNILTENLDPTVASVFTRALDRIARAGARLVSIPLPALDKLYKDINPFASFSPPEAFAWHRQLLKDHGPKYDPRVAVRILKGAEMSAADYIDLIAMRALFIDELRRALEGFDGFIMPTIAIIAPPIAPLADDAEYWRANGLALRNTSMVNFLDGCALTLPIHDEGSAPVGLSIAHVANRDRDVLSAGAALEPLFAR